MRRLLALSSTLFLALGCGNNERSGPRADCQLAAIDLSSCQRSSLAQVQPEGIWNLNVRLNDNTGSASSMRLTGESTGATLLGFNVTERQVAADTFFIASDLVDANGLPLRFAVAGCSAQGPSQMAGVFRRCRDGAVDLQGTFEAVRVTRRPGEQESSRLELVGESALPRGSATELAVAGGRAYVTAGAEGLFIYDVSTPAQPRKVGEVKPSNDFFTDVLVHGQTLYVGTRSSGIGVFDLTDPVAPNRVRSLPDRSPVEVSGLAIDGNRLYAASPYPNAEVLIYDISQPNAPALVTRYAIRDADPVAGDRPLDVTALNDRLYISHWTYGLTVVGFETPTTLKVQGRFGSSSSRTTAVGVVGNRTLAFDAGEDWGAHLSVLNVTAPTVGVDQVGEFRLRPEVSIRSVTLAGTKLYVAYYQDGLRVLDVSTPAEPRQVAYYNTWRESDSGRGLTFFDGLNNVRVPGDGYVYATETLRGLMIFRETE